MRYRRRRYRRPFCIRRRRVVKRRIHRPIGSGMLAKRFFKIRGYDIQTFSTDNRTVIYNRHDNPGSLTVTNPDWDNIVNLFDYYRVNAIKLKFIPINWILSGLCCS